jgi:taurine--2-oxoglutarate transaminase
MTTTTPATAHSSQTEARRAYELDRQYVFHTWSTQSELDPMVFVNAEGSYLWDGEGRRYLDLGSQLVNVNIGHQHPKVVDAIKRQADRMCTIAPAHAVQIRGEAARLIAERTPGDLNQIFFTNGGADANEHAVRMARLYTGRYKVLTTYRSYHGGTSTAVNMSGDPRRWLNDYGTAGTLHFWGPFLYRSAFHSTTESEECERALEHLEQLVSFEGPDSIAAVVLEPVPGTSGVMVPPPGYLRGVREVCDRFGIIMIADEVMTGFGRTGSWFEIADHGAVPDLLTFAKGVNSGYVPLGGVAIGDKIRTYFSTHYFPGGLTYSGHPLATAAVVATILAMQEEGVVENAARIGRDIIGPRLADIAERHPSVGEARGKGAMWALDLVSDPATREPIAPYGGTSEAITRLSNFLKERGILPFTYHNRMHVAPPLNTPDADLVWALGLTDEALTITDEYVVPR